ncbi:MAG: cysteine desulfurase family protein [Balneolaceae bacterium]|nr:cysteine desulfurase family protein [Balneolaceae bacterium]
MSQVYFDHAATTPLEDQVLEAMKPYFSEQFGNPNSTHQLGNNAKVAVEEARETVARVLGAEPAEIIFTSGGTESDNTAIKGALQASQKEKVLTSPLEHHAVIHPAENCKRLGKKPVYLDPTDQGKIEPDSVAEQIDENTALVSLMHVNNEIGTINPIAEISEICKEYDVPFHSDTVQSIGKLPVDVNELGVDFLSISGHKIYGPKGVGVLYVRHGTPWLPWMHGGSQERRRRGGTLNVPGIVGLARAMELIEADRGDHVTKFASLRERLTEGLEKNFPGRAHLNVDPDQSVPNILNIAFTDSNGNGLDGDMLILNLDMEGICVSSGSACTSGAREPSHVLKGIGLEPEIANSSIRISLGKANTAEDIDYFLEKLDPVLNRMATTA